VLYAWSGQKSWLILGLGYKRFDQVGEWSKFLGINEVELLDKEDEMLETRVQMGFLSQ